MNMFKTPDADKTVERETEAWAITGFDSRTETASTEGVSRKSKKSRRSTRITEKDLLRLFLKYYPVLLLLIVFVVASCMPGSFLSSENMINLLRQQTAFVLVALGMLIVMMTGGIDLSVNSQVAVSSIIVVYMLQDGGQSQSWGLMMAVVVAIIMGFIFGAVNGLLIAALRFPPFLVTLVMMYVARGIAYILTNSHPDNHTISVDQSSDAFAALSNFTNGSAAGIPYPVILTAAIVVAVGLVMHYTSFARQLSLAGRDETAGRLAGIHSAKYKVFAYAICGALCGIAGIIVASRNGSASAGTTQVNYDLITIAAVIIGGASLKGGEGNVLMTVVAVFVLAIVGSIMNLSGIDVYRQLIVKAIILLLAVLLQQFVSKAAETQGISKISGIQPSPEL
jgi:ribose transport system permease protein